NVRVCHFTTRAMAHLRGRKLPQTQTCRNLNSANLSCNFYCSMDSQDWIKLDLHIHTLDDPKDKLDYSARELLARAGRLGFGVLAITLHDAVFDHAETFAAAERMGILLIPAAEMRIEGGDIILLNVRAEEVTGLRSFHDVRALRAARGQSLFTIAPHPFYILGGSIGKRLIDEIDCFDAIEFCHFHKGVFNPNRQALRIAAKFGKPLIATSDAHRLNAFGQHYTSIPRPEQLTPDSVFAQLRQGRLRLTSPAATLLDIMSTFYFIFIEHPLRAACRHSHR
ncbi:MAG TPA: PHP domain-containing protein, partial [Candidatus Polarisedimenticolia bacterium]|nr:PHP domain-containing protein [Candidatus Polarisedimenticolia bacterium]